MIFQGWTILMYTAALSINIFLIPNITLNPKLFQKDKLSIFNIACASAQSDQRLRCSLIGKYHT